MLRTKQSYLVSRASEAKRNETRDPAQDSRSAISFPVIMSHVVWPLGPGSRSLRSLGRDTRHVSSPPNYSALMLAARITLPHFSVSLAMSLAKSPGDCANGVLPRSASRALILG